MKLSEILKYFFTDTHFKSISVPFLTNGLNLTSKKAPDQLIQRIAMRIARLIHWINFEQ